MPDRLWWLLLKVIERFPDPFSYDDNGTGRQKERFDPEEKYLPSVLINPTKHAHNIHFTPTNCKKMLELLFCAVNAILEKEG